MIWKQVENIEKKDRTYVKLFNSVISTALERVYGSETVPYERVHSWIKKTTEPVKMQQNVVDLIAYCMISQYQSVL